MRISDWSSDVCSSDLTLMMGYGYDPMLSEGSLKPPVFLTSTFAFESAAAGKRHFEGITGKRPGGAEGLVSSRFNGPNQEILEARLRSAERRVGKAGVSTCRSRWSPSLQKTNKH